MLEISTPGMLTERAWRPFVVNITVVILLFIMGVFVGLFVRNKQLIESQIQTRAEAHFRSAVLARRWNARYGGVYVEKREGIESNPYLEDPDIESTDGRIFTKKNPALMTREISEIAEEEGEFTFHITSLNPLNPGNAPDEFEANALRAFEAGETEYSAREFEKGHTYYRYMAPLMTEQGCLSCHDDQGYKVGDVRGGISVRFDISGVEGAMLANARIIIGLAAATIVVMLGMVYVFIIRLMKELEAAHQKIEHMAMTDELTGVHNRRYFFEQFAGEVSRAKRHGRTLSCVMLDVDHFKRFNDAHGHQVGDEVLKSVAAALGGSLRTSDCLARYGGEEFVELLPETGPDGAMEVAARQRQLIEKNEILHTDGEPLRVTASFGVASFTPEQLACLTDTDRVVGDADEALYRAKEAGRNRVVIANVPPGTPAEKLD